MTPVHSQFGPQGLDWQDLCRGPLSIATYQVYKLWASWFLRRRFLFYRFFSYIAVHKHMTPPPPPPPTPWSMANLDPRGLTGRIYVG